MNHICKVKYFTEDKASQLVNDINEWAEEKGAFITAIAYHVRNEGTPFELNCAIVSYYC